MATVRWSIFLYTVLQWLSNTRGQIGRLSVSVPVVQAEQLKLDEDMEPYREEIAEYENNHLLRSASNSYVALCWAAIELCLVEICKELHRRGLAATGSDIPTRKRMQRVRRVFAEAGIPIDTAIASRLDELEIVRNCVVHASGFLAYSKDKLKLQRIVEKNDWLSVATHFGLDEKKGLLVNPKYLCNLLEEIESFLDGSLNRVGIGPKLPHSR